MENKQRKPRSRERGKGKNNKGRTAVTLAISGTPEEISEIKEKAKDCGKTTSRYVIESVLH
ncbi:MAG: hypothetical protein HUJ68_01675 [Clostridia bacterium]|nr:hypothetical protein [Clostridia bacterium]